MAGIIALAQTSEVALTAATAKTVLQLLAPTNQRVKILGWGVFFDGVNTAAEPVQVRVIRQTSAGTMTASAGYAVSPVVETVQTVVSVAASVEPASSTPSGIADVVECHPQQGYEVKLPMGQELILAGGGRIGIECTAPAAVNVRAKFFFEE